jgi:magnesium transporter
MSRIAGHQAQMRGQPPGTLQHIGERKTSDARITITRYDAEKYEVLEVDDFEACRAHLEGSSGVVWVNVDGIHEPAGIEKLGKVFGLHPLLLEDVMNAGQRPKLEEYDEHAFIVLKMLFWDEAHEKIMIEQVSFVLGERFVLSFQEREGDVFDDVRERLRAAKGRIRKNGADYLAYRLIDAIVDNYFLVLERVGDMVEDLEVQITTSSGAQALRDLHVLKREVLYLRKAVWPAREVIGAFARLEEPLLKAPTVPFVRDTYDHTIQSADTIEIMRDVLASLLDVSLSTSSQRLNETMKVLAIISTIFIPLTFIAGLYGMNFEFMPELHSRWGYPIILLVMAGIALGQVYYFKRKHWW